MLLLLLVVTGEEIDIVDFALTGDVEVFVTQGSGFDDLQRNLSRDFSTQDNGECPDC